LALEREQVIEYLDKLDHETKAIKEEALRFCWYMRGGLTYNDALTLSAQEREIVGKIVKNNLETTKESGLPFF
jgi:hypothetical protein